MLSHFEDAPAKSELLLAGSAPKREPPEDDELLKRLSEGLPTRLSKTMNTSNPHPLYSKVRSRKCLREAWRIVRQNGINSKSIDTQKQVREFEIRSETHIENLYRQLLYQKFKFSPAVGVLQKRPAKTPRPLVVSSLTDRIVRRSILDVLQGQEAIKPFFKVNNSFGGIEEKGVRQAIEAALKAIRGGADYFISSDIKDFFVRIPRDIVLQKIQNVINDHAFNKLLNDAVKTELKNMASLDKYKNLFPIYTIGVAQGCCLSPLFGNILLNEFDIDMNGRGITCLRYIDDFILFGRNESSVAKAFLHAQQHLMRLGFTVYNPLHHPLKASSGRVKEGFEFLGCQIIPGFVRPSEKTRKRLISKIESLLKESYAAMSNAETIQGKKTFIQSLVDVSNTVRGWGNQYSFCNDIQVMEHLDVKIYELVRRYIRGYSEKIKNLDPKNIRRIFGVYCLTDCNSKPLLPLKN